jgi:uncharacterized membrane protein (DUF4010 family)
LLAATAVAVCFALAAAHWRGEKADVPPETKLSNPLQFWSVVGFALFLSAIIVAGRTLGETAGAAGTLLGAALIGVADVDAITVAVVRLVPQPLSELSAAVAVLVAVATNTIGKIAIGSAVGGGVFAVGIAGMALASLAAGGAALWLTSQLVAA